MLNKRLLSYGALTILSGIFSITYEYFSHGVYSNYMVYLFTIPLVLGVIPELLTLLFPKLKINNSSQRLTLDFAIATLMIGSTLQGILEIYGTTSVYVIYYLYAGIGLLALSIYLWLITYLRQPVKS